MPKVKSAKRSGGKSASGSSEAASGRQGMVFNTGLGQHILKNPLVVQGIIDKSALRYKNKQTNNIPQI